MFEVKKHTKVPLRNPTQVCLPDSYKYVNQEFGVYFISKIILLTFEMLDLAVLLNTVKLTLRDAAIEYFLDLKIFLGSLGNTE